MQLKYLYKILGLSIVSILSITFVAESIDIGIDIPFDYVEDFLKVDSWGIMAKIEDARGNCELAIIYANKCISNNSITFPCYTYKSDCLIKLGRYEEALATCIKANELAPFRADFWYGTALCQIMLNNSYEALDPIDRALDLEPHSSDSHIYWFLKGVALSNLGKHEDAIVAYDKAIEMKPQHSISWNNKGFVLYNQGKYEDAINVFEGAIIIEPRFALAWHNKGMALNMLGRTREAYAAFYRAEELGYTKDDKILTEDPLRKHIEPLFKINLSEA